MLRNTLKTLLSAYGPSGNERAVRETLALMLEGHADDIATDAMGNLIVTKLGTDERAPRIMFSAHMDHIGLVVTDVEKEGFLRVQAVGGIGVAGMRLRHVVFENGVQGVVAVQPPRHGEDEAMRHLFIDIGAESREDALRQVDIGDMAVFAPDFFELGRHRVGSPAMDDRCACALLAELLMYLDEPKCTVIGVFSVQEEVGCRGAQTAAFAVDPDMGVALDVTAWGDTPETKLPAVRLGAGAAVKFLDRSMIASPAVRQALLDAADAAGVPAQREVLAFGGTDGGVMQHTRGGIPTGTLSIPCRYVHSACEVIDMRDMEGALKILLQFCRSAGGDA